VAALVLNPRRKWSYFKKNWDNKAWVTDAEKLMLSLWNQYKPQDTDTTPSHVAPKTTNEFLIYLEEQDDDIEAVDDEYTHYCAQPTVKVLDAREWWLQPAQQQLYPHLSKLALESGDSLNPCYVSRARKTLLCHQVDHY
jgi:hypothetical protein